MMYAEERRQSIAAETRRVGRVDVASLAERLDVTTETVRRDLSDLEQRGVLRRVHGGAIAVERLRLEPDVAEKAGRLAAEKSRIAEVAAREIPAGGTILLDAGTTTGALVDHLPSDRDLTVITNSLPTAMRLTAQPNIELLLLGGRVRERTLASVDDWAVRILHEITVDVAFVATNGITVRGGLTTPDLAEASVKRAMVASAQRVVLLADHTKVGQQHFAKFAELHDVDLFVTDTGLGADGARSMEDAGVEVVLA